MTRNRVDPNPISGSGSASDSSPAAVSLENVVNDAPDTKEPLGGADPSSPSVSQVPSVPWPESTFIIRSKSSGEVIMLRGGQIVLAQPEVHANYLWECVESNGWYGFRNHSSGKFLGHNKAGRLCCSVGWLKEWERFHVKHTPDGGYVLLLTHFKEKLWHVGLIRDKGVEKLAKVANDGVSPAIVWEFLKV